MISFGKTASSHSGLIPLKTAYVGMSQKLDYSKEEWVKQFKFVLAFVQSHHSLQTFSHKHPAAWMQVI